MTVRMLRRCLIAPLALALVAALATAPANASPDAFVVRNARVFDGLRVTGTGSVLVVRGRIAAVGRVATPPGARVYDGRGKTLLPGLIDGHAHTLDTDEARADRHDALRLGVTTELGMWGDPAEIPNARRQRRSLDRTDAADLWSAGTGVTVPGGLGPDFPGLPPFPRLAPGDDPARFVADRVAEGSDYIKFLIDDGSLFGLDAPTLSPAQVRTIVAAAHRRGRMAVGHVTELEHARTAVNARADGLVHVFLDAIADDAFLREIRRRGTFVISTLAVWDCGVGAADILADPRVRPFLSARQIQFLTPFPGCPASWLQVGSENIRRLHAAGVPIIAGTDAGALFSAHGASLLAELSHLVRAGLTPPEALTAATATPARRFHLGDRGRIAPGFRADLLLVNGDPTTDITAVRDMNVIWKNGRPIDRSLD